VLIQFPLYGGIASILTSPRVLTGIAWRNSWRPFFTHIATAGSFPW